MGGIQQVLLIMQVVDKFLRFFEEWYVSLATNHSDVYQLLCIAQTLI